jgi:hypothetical protein
MRARDIIDVCLLAARRLVGSSVHSRRLREHERGLVPAIFLACCALTDLPSLACAQSARHEADARATPHWRWPEALPSGADCITRADLERRIEEQLGRPLSKADFAFSFSAHIQRGADTFRLVLVSDYDGQHGERTFEGATCREVSEAAVLLIALSLDDARASQGAAPAREAPASATQSGAPRATPARAEQAATQAHDRPRAHWGLGAGALLDVGTLPRAAAGVELGASAAFARSRFGLRALGLPAVRSERTSDGSRVEVGLWAARLSYCHTLAVVPGAHAAARASTLGSRADEPSASTRLSLGACLGFELGKAFGRGVDLRLPEPIRLMWAAGWLAVRAAVALNQHWALALEPALAMPVERGRFVSSDAQSAPSATLYTQAWLVKRVSLALEVSF